MKKKIIIIICVFICAVLGRFLFSSFGKWQSGKMMKMGRTPSVTVVEIGEADVIKSFNAPARVNSISELKIVPRVSGYLTKSFFKEGDFVKKGQVLFEIEPKEWQLAANKAKASLDNAKAQLSYYNKQLVRYAELVKQDFVAKAQYDQILSQRDSYKAQVDLNLSAYEDALRNLSYTRVKSAVDGQAGLILVTVGNYVSPSSGPLAVINSNNPMYVTFPIDVKDYTELVRIDKTANINRVVDLFFSDGVMYEHSGECDFHDNYIDQSTGTITMRATFKNPEGLLIHGNFANVKIYSKQKTNVIVAPQTAVMENPQGKYVYKLDEDGLPQVQSIQVSGLNGKNWIVTSGLKKGDRIVMSGIQKVIPGNPVRIISQDEMEKEEVNVKTPDKVKTEEE